MIRQFGSVTGITQQPIGLNFGVGGGSNIKSIQSGQTTASGTTTNVTITSVDITKAIVVVTVAGNTGSNGEAYYYAPIAKLSSTTNLQLTLTAYSAIYRPTFSWQVIEFNNIKSLQTGSLTANASVNNVAITSVNVLKSMVVAQVNGGSGSYFTDGIGIAYLTSSTNLATLGGTGATTKTLYWQVIEFQ